MAKCDALLETGALRAGAAAQRAERSEQKATSHAVASGTNFMRKTRLPSSPSLRPRLAVVLRDVERLFVDAGVDAAGLRGVEGDAPDASEGRPALRDLPGLAAVFGERHADAPSGDRDARWARRGRRRCRRDFGPLPRLPSLSKVTPQSVETKSPPPWVAASQWQGSCGDCSTCSTWNPAAPAGCQVLPPSSLRKMPSSLPATQDAALARIHADGLRCTCGAVRRWRRCQVAPPSWVTRMPAVWLK